MKKIYRLYASLARYSIERPIIVGISMMWILILCLIVVFGGHSLIQDMIK